MSMMPKPCAWPVARWQLAPYLLALGAAFPASASAHGGSYVGPGTTVPNGPGNPSTPAAGGGLPSTPTASTPLPSGGAGPSTVGGADGRGLDPTSWEHWWHFNKDPYLGLKARILAGEVSTHGDDPLGTAAGPVATFAVPALVRTLETEHEQDVVTGAMIALARIADGDLRVHAAEWSALFERFERDPNQEIAETSLVARGILGWEGSAPGLADLLLDGPEGRKREGGRAVTTRTRSFAAYALGLLGERARSEDLRRFVVHHLLHALREESVRGADAHKALPDLQTATAIAIGIVPLAWAGKDVNGKPKTPAGGLSRESEIENLLLLLRDKEQPAAARAHAPESLARLLAGAPTETRDAVVKDLINALSDAREKNEVAAGCALALGRIGDADRDPTDVMIRAVLRRASDDVDVPTRCFALIALAEVGSRPGEGEDPEIGARDAQEFLLNRLAHGKVREREWSALGLGVLERARISAGREPSLSVRSSLRGALFDAASSDEIGALSIAEGLAGDRSCADLLLKKLERNADAGTRGYLAVGLGMVGAEEALGPLKKVLGESRYRPDILREAAIGLALLGDRELVPNLLTTLSEAHGAAAQAAAATALGFIGDARTLEPLAKLCANQNTPTSARAFATVALGIVGDRDRLPWHVSIACGINYRAITETLLDPHGAGLLDIL
jgi:HEAT repeat protein